MLAGNFDFAFSYGQEEMQDIANAMATDNAGNTYIAGTFQRRIDVDPRAGVTHLLKSNGDEPDGFVAKYSASGRLIWAQRFGGLNSDGATAIKVAPGGRRLHRRQLRGHRRLWPARSSTCSWSGHGNRDGFIAHLDTRGRLLWVGAVGGEEDDWINAIDVGQDNSVFVAGTIRMKGDVDPGPAVHEVTCRGVDDAFIARLNPKTGNRMWSVEYGEENTTESAFGLAADGKGGVYATGAYRARGAVRSEQRCVHPPVRKGPRRRLHRPPRRQGEVQLHHQHRRPGERRAGRARPRAERRPLRHGEFREVGEFRPNREQGAVGHCPIATSSSRAITPRAGT